jgi:cobalamin synthase
MHTARKRLALAWFAGAGVCFVVLLFISFFASTADLTGLWEWFLPAIVPNLSLIIGVLVYTQRQQVATDTRIDPFLYRLALWLSLLYVLLLLLPLVFFPVTGKTLPELLDISRLWLAAVQGLVTGVMGAFFVRQDGK